MEAKRPRLQGPTTHSKPAPAAVSAPSQAAVPAAKLAGADLPSALQHSSAPSEHRLNTFSALGMPPCAHPAAHDD